MQHLEGSGMPLLNIGRTVLKGYFTLYLNQCAVDDDVCHWRCM